jgi:ubiquinone biosynthesis monooxygenase Coq7
MPLNPLQEPLNNEQKAMIRVNQAGEYGAQCIYRGQIWALKNSSNRGVFEKIKSDEDNHLIMFNDLSIRHEVRPTFMQPLWSIFGHALGIATGLLGEKYAHACTIAVEDVIDTHYADQLKSFEGRELNSDEMELKCVIEECHQEEINHRTIAENNGGKDAPELFTKAIRKACELAIFISKRI